MNKFIHIRILITAIAIGACAGMMQASEYISLCAQYSAHHSALRVYPESGHIINLDRIPSIVQETENPLGIEVEPVELTRGVKIKSVQPEGLAERLGLQAGDIITSLNEEMIYSTSQFEEVLSHLQAGREVEIKVQRGVEQVTAQFQLQPK